MRPVRPDEALLPPVATAAVPGTSYQLAIVGLPRAVSGPAAASLPAGIGSILVSFVVGCFALLGAQDGWGTAVSGAFALLATFAGIAAISLGAAGARQARHAPDRITGRGVAMAGIVCGFIGIGFTVVAFVLSVAASM
jgi:hypothetical protein